MNLFYRYCRYLFRWYSVNSFKLIFIYPHTLHIWAFIINKERISQKFLSVCAFISLGHRLIPIGVIKFFSQSSHFCFIGFTKGKNLYVSHFWFLWILRRLFCFIVLDDVDSYRTDICLDSARYFYYSLSVDFPFCCVK